MCFNRFGSYNIVHNSCYAVIVSVKKTYDNYDLRQSMPRPVG